MPLRFLRPGIRTSSRWNSVSHEAARLYIAIMTLADDYGRYDGRHAVLWADAFAVWNDQNPHCAVNLPQVAALCRELHASKLVTFYTIDGKQYLQVQQWQERVRGKSKWPEPPAGTCGDLPQVAASCGDLPQVAASCGGNPPPEPEPAPVAESQRSQEPCHALCGGENGETALGGKDDDSNHIAPRVAVQRKPEETQAKVKALHETWQRISGITRPMDAAAERLWFDWLRAATPEWTPSHLATVISHVMRGIRAGDRNEGALKLQNLLDPARFADDLGIATRSKPQKPSAKPAPKRQEPPQQEASPEAKAEFLAKLGKVISGVCDKSAEKACNGE